MAAANKKRACKAAQKVPLARLNVVSAIFQTVSWRFDPLWWNETSPPCIMLSTNVHPVFPASLSVSNPHIHSLCGLPYCRSYPVSSVVHARNIRCVYSVFVTPTPAPQCLHLIMKSGYRPIAGAVNCIFIFVSASMIFRPHFGHRTRRQLIFISCPCSSFFLCIHVHSFPATYHWLHREYI